MKRILLTIIGMLFIGFVFSQVVSESTIRKFNIGVGISTDIWQGQPPDMRVRTINQGAQVFGLYTHRIKESAIYLAGGIGIRMHNMYSDNYIEDVGVNLLEKISNLYFLTSDEKDSIRDNIIDMHNGKNDISTHLPYSLFSGT